MDTYTETIKFDRRLEVALVSWDASPQPAPLTVSESEKQEWETCRSCAHRSPTRPGRSSLPRTSSRLGGNVIGKSLSGKERKLDMKINLQMSRRSQVILLPCWGTTRPPPYPDFFPKMHQMQANRPYGLQRPHHSHWCGQAGSISSQQVEKLPGSEEHIGSSETLWPGELGAGALPAQPAPGVRQPTQPSGGSLSGPSI